MILLLHQKSLQGPNLPELDLCGRRDLLSLGELFTSLTRNNHRLIVMGGSVSVPPGTHSPDSPSLPGPSSL